MFWAAISGRYRVLNHIIHHQFSGAGSLVAETTVRIDWNSRSRYKNKICWLERFGEGWARERSEQWNQAEQGRRFPRPPPPTAVVRSAGPRGSQYVLCLRLRHAWQELDGFMCVAVENAAEQKRRAKIQEACARHISRAEADVFAWCPDGENPTMNVWRCWRNMSQQE
eukprot:1679966-Amphidinium_carterae.1